jgi:hypothetical protein
VQRVRFPGTIELPPKLREEAKGPITAFETVPFFSRTYLQIQLV